MRPYKYSETPLPLGKTAQQCLYSGLQKLHGSGGLPTVPRPGLLGVYVFLVQRHPTRHRVLRGPSLCLLHARLLQVRTIQRMCARAAFVVALVDKCVCIQNTTAAYVSGCSDKTALAETAT